MPNYAKEMASNLKKSNDLIIKEIFGSEEIRKEVREHLKHSEYLEELEAFEEIFDKS
jgi:translation initiation factor 2 beta subunit (eIF-2beta)/eIF-5